LQQKSRILNRFNTQGLDEQLRQRLDEIVQEELRAIRKRQLDTAREASGTADRSEALEELFRKEEMLSGLPDKLIPAVDRLREYDFQDAGAARRFREFLEMMERVMEFSRKNFFRGGQDMGLDQTEELMEQIARLDKLIRELERGNLEGIDLDELAEQLGEDAGRSIRRFMEFAELLKQGGYVLEEGSEMRLSPKAMAVIGQKALKDIYSLVGRGSFGPHQTSFTGMGVDLPDETKLLEFGDQLNLHYTKTVMNAVKRTCAEGGRLPRDGQAGVRLSPEDFEVKRMERHSNTATVLMLDMSLSMFQGGRFSAAKKVALAMEHLIRTRFPRDHFYVVGFATFARRMNRSQLLHASGNLGDDIFTNIQDGLNLASRLLSRHREANPQVILITDGQPTAFRMNGRLHIEWPTLGISPTASRETLKEVRRISAEKITINTFMLDREPALVKFVEQLTRINKGRAFFTSPQHLGRYLLLDYMGKKKRRLH